MDVDFFRRNKKQITKIIVLTIIVLTLYRLISNSSATMASVVRFFNIIKPFILAGILAYLLYFPCNFLENRLFKKTKSKTIKRVLSIAIVYIIFLIFLSLILSYLIPIIFNSVVEIVKSMPDYLESLKNIIYNIPEESFFANFKLDIVLNKVEQLTTENLQTEVMNYLNLERILGYTSQLIDFIKSLIQFILTFLVSIYMLFEREKIAEYFKRFLEARTQKKTYIKTLDILRDANNIFRKYIVSQFTDAFIVGIIMIIGLLALKVKYAVLLGFLIGLFNLIPVFGALTAGIVATMLTIVTGGPELALKTVLLILVLQQIDANIIQPKIVGENLKVSRILVIIATTLGGAYFGVWGMFFGVPILTTIKAVIDKITDNKIKENKIKRLINKRLLIKIKRPNKNTVKRLRIRNRIKA